MTLKTEFPISIDHKARRVYHQHHHHHHYHLHHILDHHHLHIHNQSVFRSHVSNHHLPQQQIQQQQPIRYELRSRTQIEEPTTPANRNLSSSSSSSSSSLQLQQQSEQYVHADISQMDHDSRISNQLVQSRRLTHVIGASSHLDRERPIISPTVAAIQQSIHRGDATTNTTKSKQRSQIQFLLLSAFAYILSPIDIIPEAIFGIFGILDDLVFLIMCLFCVAIILLYPLFREMRRTLFDKLGLKQQQQCTELDNKNL